MCFYELWYAQLFCLIVLVLELSLKEPSDACKEGSVGHLLVV